jgi:hypothetical protein
VTKVVTVRTFISLPLAVYGVGGGVVAIITNSARFLDRNSLHPKHEQPKQEA